ncbi:MAG: RloB domain-containing protein [Bacteroidales bacterium]|nr:RloB domain-containing protein [Bacteroidales bacterium]
MARKTSLKQRRSPIPTIIGAGITEQWYFTHLKALRGYRVKIRPRFFGTETAAGLDKKIEEVLRDEGIAVCVFDADVSTWNDTERKKLAALQKKYKGNPSVLLCDSMPSIEYWFLLHYKHTTRHFGTSKSVIKELKKYIPQYDKTEQFLSNPKWVVDMSGEGRQELACDYAAHTDTTQVSYTQVQKAIRKMEFPMQH